MYSKESLQLLLKRLKESSGKKKDVDDLLESDQEIIDQIVEEDLVDDALELLYNLDVDGDWEVIKARLDEKSPKRFEIQSVLKYAAIFIGLIALGAAVVHFNKNQTKAMQADIDGDFVSLDTGNGIKIIDEKVEHSIKLPSGNTVLHSGDTLIYDAGSEGESPIYNELHIPNGLMFTLVLSDGTRVNLNSGTRIKFPVMFPEKGNREVFIHGEAYFDVTKDNERPFIVNSGDVRVSVLGTEFNFSSYDSQNEVATVLVEGSVRLNPNSNLNESTLLVPGDKGAWSRSKGEMEVEQVNTSLYTGWKNGEVVFRNTSFPELLETLERVYDVDIKNANDNIINQTFNARFNRNVERIEDVLNGLQVIAPFEYTIQQKDKAKDKEIIIK
ncbi:MAG: DUF4974 domain-containing protein [Algicola sp.]|nr:DUF4974 domain-containing protein [Algicola sp.]